MSSTIAFFREYTTGPITVRKLIEMLWREREISCAFKRAGVEEEAFLNEVTEESFEGARIRQRLVNIKGEHEEYLRLILPLLDRTTDAALELLLVYANPVALNGGRPSPQTFVDAHIPLATFAKSAMERLARQNPRLQAKINAVGNQLH